MTAAPKKKNSVKYCFSGSKQIDDITKADKCENEVKETHITSALKLMTSSNTACSKPMIKNQTT